MTSSPTLSSSFFKTNWDSCCAVLCCAVLCCAVPCCVVLCCVVFFCVVLHCVVMCCVVVLCCVILHYNMNILDMLQYVCECAPLWVHILLEAAQFSRLIGIRVVLCCVALSFECMEPCHGGAR